MTRTLGKGLAALLGEEETVREGQAISLSQILPCESQPRKTFNKEDLSSLIESIKEKGVLQPILIRKHPSLPHKYEIIAGERRWRAASALGLAEIPAIIKNVSSNEALELALIENVQRQDLNAIEEAEGYQRLLEEYNYTQDKIARMIGKSRSHIANTLRLNNLSAKIKEYVKENKISAGHARAVLNHPQAEQLLDEIIANQYNVRETEELVRKTTTKQVRRPSKPEKPYDIQIIEDKLMELLKLPVEIHLNDEQGHLIIKFNKVEEIDKLINRLAVKAA